jgi:hypothetical protein
MAASQSAAAQNLQLKKNRNTLVQTFLHKAFALCALLHRKIKFVAKVHATTSGTERAIMKQPWTTGKFLKLKISKNKTYLEHAKQSVCT